MKTFCWAKLKLIFGHLALICVCPTDALQLSHVPILFCGRSSLTGLHFPWCTRVSPLSELPHVRCSLAKVAQTILENKDMGQSRVRLLWNTGCSGGHSSMSDWNITKYISKWVFSAISISRKIWISPESERKQKLKYQNFLQDGNSDFQLAHALVLCRPSAQGWTSPQINSPVISLFSASYRMWNSSFWR